MRTRIHANHPLMRIQCRPEGVACSNPTGRLRRENRPYAAFFRIAITVLRRNVITTGSPAFRSGSNASSGS